VPKLPVFYNCRNCPGYCCSYDHIESTAADIRRLAKHFGVDEETARERFTKPQDGDEKRRILRHQADVHFGTVCRFFDTEQRRCSIYEARPSICRRFPGTARCGFYDFLMSERRSQEDPEYVPSFTRG
jgi:hypothetical protein